MSHFEVENGVLIRYVPDDSENISVTIPDGVKEIHSSAFKMIKSITSVNIPEGVEIIGEAAFFMCTKLEKVILPSTLKEIHKNAFYSCRSLKSITLYEGITMISESSFKGCRSLVRINIPDSVTTIEAFAFSDCSALRNVVLPDSIRNIGEHAFEYCGITKLTIPPLVTRIAPNAFSMCGALRSVTLHSNIENIGEYAFASCGNLRKINYTAGSTQLQIDANAFRFTPWEEYYPDGFAQLNGFLCKYTGEETDVVIPPHIRYIGEKAFYSKKVTSVTIPSTVQVIHSRAFELCHELKKLTIGAHRICRYAFITSSLEKIVLKDTVKDIDSGAFVMSNLLRTVTYLHTTADMPKLIWLPFEGEFTYIYAPNADISVFYKHNEAASYCDAAAAGYADMVISGHSISPEIAKGYHSHLTERCNELLKYATRNENILNYFCRYNLLDLKATDHLLESTSDNTTATAILLQYKHENFGDGQDYEL